MDIGINYLYTGIRHHR